MMTATPLKRPRIRRPVVTDRVLAFGFLVGLAAVAVWSLAVGTAPGGVRLVPCPIDAVTGVACPGCGMTRACVALARGEWANAWSLHPFSFLLVALALAVAAAPDATRRGVQAMPRVLRTAAVTLAIVAVLVRWTVDLFSA